MARVKHAGKQKELQLQPQKTMVLRNGKTRMMLKSEYEAEREEAEKENESHS